MPYDKPHFTNFPYEIQLQILHYLEPLDVISTEMTCKVMHCLAREKRLWVNIMRDMCEKNSVFLPTYPEFEQMSLEELKRSATSPGRFLQFLERQKTGQVLAGMKKWELKDILNGLEDSEFLNLYLVPGGRYLVTFPPQYIVLLDIDHQPQRPLAFWNEAVLEFAVGSTSDGLGVRIVIITYASKIEVLDIYPSSPKPEFVNIATLDCSGGEDIDGILSVHGDTIVLLEGHFVRLWNPITRKAAFWKVTELYKQLIVTENTVVMISCNSISVWRIPDLIPQSDALSLQDVDVLPPDANFELPHPFPEHEDLIYLSVPCNWSTGPKQDVLIDFVVRYRDSSSKNGPNLEGVTWIHSLFRYQLTPKKAPGTDLSAYAPLLINTYNLESSGKGFSIEESRFCNSQLVTLWSEQDPPHSWREDAAKTKIHIGGRGGSESPQEPGKQYILLPNFASTDKEFAFCPVSGRLCYVEHSSPVDLLFVIDFINH